VLGLAVPQAGHRATLRAVDLQFEELVAVDAHAPRGVDLGHDAARELEGSVCRVVGRRLVGFAFLVPTLWLVRGTEAGDGFDLAEEVV
jgi:hypothetical protein